MNDQISGLQVLQLECPIKGNRHDTDTGSQVAKSALNLQIPIAQGIEKLPRSYNLEGDCRTELHTSPMGTIDSPRSSPFLEINFLKNYR